MQPPMQSPLKDSRQQAPGQRRADEARLRAERRTQQSRAYETVNGMFRINPGDFIAFLKTAAKWLLLGSGVGILAGTASAIFLVALGWATTTRSAYPYLLFLLPVAGLFLGWLYLNYAGAAARGNNLVIDEVHNNRQPIPLRMAPLVLAGTVITHLFGGSAGREGTAIQMGSSLADWLARRFGLSREDRRMMLMAGISGGFGSVFGTPVAGFVFGMEVQSIGRIRYEGMIPCLVAAVVGDLVTRAWGVSHAHYPKLVEMTLDSGLLLKVTLAGIAFGVASFVFIELTHGIKHLTTRLLAWSPARPVVGGLVIIGLTLLLGTQDYLGLSLPLIQHSMDGRGVIALAFLLKTLFTSITLGSGFLGGEVTPLFVIGSTLGYTMGRLLGVDPSFMAAIGFVSVFAGAANTPLACALMGIELFGGGSALYLVLGCSAAYLASGHRSIYMTQRIGVPKLAVLDTTADESVEALGARRPGWLPDLPALMNNVALRPVSSIMSPHPVAVRIDTPLTQLVDIAINEGVRTLPVVDTQGVIVGIITDNDLRRRGRLALPLGLMRSLTVDERAALLANIPNDVARDMMTTPAMTLLDRATLTDAVALLASHDLKRVAVVNQRGHLLGILTRSDVLRQLIFSQLSLVWSIQGQVVRLGWDAPVEQIMSSEITIVQPSTPVNEVVQMMVNTAQKRIVVVDDSGQPLGMITDSDLLNRIAQNNRPTLLAALSAARTHSQPTNEFTFDYGTQIASDVMTTSIFTIPAGTTARDALRLLLEKHIKRLPVIGANGEVIGLVGRAGLMRAILKTPPVSR